MHSHTVLLIAAVALAATSPVGEFAASFAPQSGDGTNTAEQVEIGNNRRLYLMCDGPALTGQPTIILVSGYHDSSDPWTETDAL